MNDSDASLIKNCLDGDQSAFESLVSRYQAVIYNGALKMVRDPLDAEDIAQITFVKAYERLDSYSPRYKFFSWIYRIMVNETINFLHKKKSFAELTSKIESPHKNPEQLFVESEISEMVNDALMELQPDSRLVIVLKHFADLSYREISYVLDLPEKKVKSRLFEGRKRLCRILKEKGYQLNA